jgi:phosphate transport system regulatory protein PhoU
MGERAEALVELAVDALLARDADAADAVVAGDRELDLLEVEVEETAVQLLALQQPMARDLRFLVGAIKVSSDLERVGDHAVNIAQSTRRLAERAHDGAAPRPRARGHGPPRAPHARRRARRLHARRRRARPRVCRADDAVDALYDSVFRILLTHMMADARTITPSLELLLVSRNLERVADLATNIGEDAVYVAEAKQIRHRAEQPRGRAVTAGPLPNGPGADGAAPRVVAPAGADVLPDRTSHEIETAPTAASSRTLRIAAVDIGSNSIRMIVADVSPAGDIRVVDEMKAMPRLGVGVDRTGVLAEASMDAALAALARMGTLARQMHADRVEAVATSAVRDAANGGTFLDRVRGETGLRVRLLSGEEEARLSFRSALAHFELATGRTVVMDIGGGSLELALAAEGLLERLVSLPFGAIRATEQFLAEAAEGGRGHGATTRALRELRRAVRWAVRDELPVREWRGARVVGSGGTFTNLAGVVAARSAKAAAKGSRGPGHALAPRHGGVARRRRARARPARRDDVGRARRGARAQPGARRHHRRRPRHGRRGARRVRGARAPRVGLRHPRGAAARGGRGRAHPGRPGRGARALGARLRRAVPLRAAARRAGAAARAPPVRPARRPARRRRRRPRGARRRGAPPRRGLPHQLREAPQALVPPHPARRPARRDAAEQEAVAQVARYHRGRLPSERHPAFAALDRAGRRRVRRLAALLRVADGMDRGHASAVGDVRVEWDGERCRLVATPAEGADTLRLDVWGGERKGDLLARLLRAPLEVVAHEDGDGAADAAGGDRAAPAAAPPTGAA